MLPNGRDEWVEHLSKREMPVLSGILTELNALTGDDDTEVNQLADVILKDANLTSQVLRIANSVHYNPSNYPINTVSRAIILIGFRGVRAICISVMVIDSLLGKEPREHLLEIMAQSFHAAVQARNLMRTANTEVQEEVFIAALLYHLGQMAFWASGSAAVGVLDEKLNQADTSFREAAEEVLGCSFKSISSALADSWNLGELLKQALYPSQSPTPKATAVILGQQLSEAARQGWDSVEADTVIKRIAGFSGATVADTKKQVLDGADEASRVALTYGAARVCHLIPSRIQQHGGSPDNDGFEAMKADPQLQLNILRELSNAVMENLDVNAIFQMVLEGLHRGVGMERVALCFVRDDKVQAKFVLGANTSHWREQFHIPVGKLDENLFSKAIKVKEPVWFKASDISRNQHLYSPKICQVIGKGGAFVSGIYIGNRCIAVFYADRWQLGADISNEQFQSFRHFMLQTQMSLQMLAESR